MMEKTLTGEFLSTSDRRWYEFLERVRHDIYHRPEYVEAASRHEGGEAKAFYAQAYGTEMLIPVLIRDLPSHLQAPSHWKDLTSPYGYPSPLILSSDPQGISHCLKIFKQQGKNLGIVSAFLRLHPLIPFDLLPFSQHGNLVRHGPSVLIDLDKPEEDIWKNTKNDHKNSIRRLTKEGFTVEFDQWDDYDQFIEIYLSTMRRLNAADFYQFPKQYFYDLRSSLSEFLHLCVVRAPQGQIASAGIFFVCNEYLQYHLGGVAEDFIKKAPAKLEIDAVRWWGRERGVKVANLGGGVGGSQDTLFSFKLRFSGTTEEFFTYRMIIDPAKYDYLTKKNEKIVTDNDFFPEYRRYVPSKGCFERLVSKLQLALSFPLATWQSFDSLLGLY